MAKVQTEAEKQASIVNQWQAFSHQLAYQDLIEYIDSMREMYREYAEERAMPHPDPNKGETVFLDNETTASLLQNSRGLNIVKTYIESRVDSDVVQKSQTK